MENDLRNKQRKSYTLMRMSYDLTMAIVILGMALVMLLGDKLNVPVIASFVSNVEPLMRYLFGGLCVVYGIFRLYRAFKRDY